MNLIPTLISLGLAASVSVFYLQNQSDEPNKINYRAALSDFEQTALEFAGHTPLQNISAAMPPSHCANLSYDFESRLPAGTESAIDISGLNCDMATLKISTSDEKDFQALHSAASASGRIYTTETDTSATPTTKTIKWTQRLYSRNTFDLGAKAKLINNYTGNCISCTSSTKAVHGEWSHERDPNVRWIGCPAPGVLACGTIKETRTCNNPPPLNFGKECPRINGTLTTPSDRTETRDCLKVPECGKLTENICPTNICLKDENEKRMKSITCSGSPCKLNDGKVVESGYTVYCDTPSCGTWNEQECKATHCLSDHEKDPNKTCAGGGCFNNKVKLVKSGTEEKCQLPTCTPLTLDQDCPATKNNCNITEPPPKKYICNGPRCKYEGMVLYQGGMYKSYCLSRPCGKLSKGEIKGIQSNCIPKDKHMQNDRPIIEYTCDGEFGCKDEKGKFYEGDKSIKERLNLPGCPYWGEWYDVGHCEYDKDEGNGLQEQNRDCFRRQLNGIPKPEERNLCSDNKNDFFQKIPCDYPWGNWERTENCSDNCIKDDQKELKYEICNAENEKFCKKEINGIYKNKTYKNGEYITCGDVKPICGKWGEWSKPCKFKVDGDDDEKYGSCDKKDGIQKRECSTDYCKDPIGTDNKTDTQSCYSEKCQINIDNNIDKQIRIDDYVKGDASNRDLRVIISKKSYFSAPKSTTCAIRSKGNFKKLTIINHGIITGYSGKGGAGAKPVIDHNSNLSDKYKGLIGGVGEDGGDAICIGSKNKYIKVEIVNKGIIKGGRAGGGGGGGTCYDIKKDFGISIEENCLNGGDGGDGSDSYLPTIMKGKDGQKRIEETFVIKSGTGGDGGVLFKENTVKVDEIPREAFSGKEGVLIKMPRYNSDIEIFTGEGGEQGFNGSPCRVKMKLSDCD